MNKITAMIALLPLSLVVFGFKQSPSTEVEKIPAVSPCVKDNSCVAPKPEKEVKEKKTHHDKGGNR